MLSSAHAGGTTGTARVVRNPLFEAIEWGLDRMLSVGYGVVYDCIFERFRPYQDLREEVCRLIETTVTDGADRPKIRVLNLGCGPGNFAVPLAAAGFSVIGLDRYGALVDVAREKRRARRLAHLAFRHGDLAEGAGFLEGSFDHVVNIHSLYVHPAPDRLLSEAYRVLKPGGHAIFVNHTRHVSLGSTFRDLK